MKWQVLAHFCVDKTREKLQGHQSGVFTPSAWHCSQAAARTTMRHQGAQRLGKECRSRGHRKPPLPKLACLQHPHLTLKGSEGLDKGRGSGGAAKPGGAGRNTEIIISVSRPSPPGLAALRRPPGPTLVRHSPP